MFGPPHVQLGTLNVVPRHALHLEPDDLAAIVVTMLFEGVASGHEAITLRSSRDARHSERLGNNTKFAGIVLLAGTLSCLLHG